MGGIDMASQGKILLALIKLVLPDRRERVFLTVHDLRLEVFSHGIERTY